MNLSKTLQACNSSESFGNWNNEIIRLIDVRLDSSHEALSPWSIFCNHGNVRGEGQTLISSYHV
jgi:hypothetical protein